MLIVDSQVHLSETEPNPARGQIAGGVYAEEILKEMDAAGVDRAILAAVVWNTTSTAQCLEAAQRYPDRFAVFGRVMVNDPGIRERIRDWKRQPGMLGVRVNTTGLVREAPQSIEPGYWLWSALEQAGMPVMLHAVDHFGIVAPIADRHPGLRLSLCHMGVDTYGGKDEAAFPHLPELLKLAGFANVSVKASGLPSYSSEAYPFPRLHPILRQIYDAFGPERIFWGTDLTRVTYWDLPGRPRKCTYRQAVTMFTEEIPWLNDEDKALIMGRALCRWAGWPLP